MKDNYLNANDEKWIKEMVEKYPFSNEQLEQKKAIEEGDDMPFVLYNNKRFYYDNNTEYLHVLDKIEDMKYCEA